MLKFLCHADGADNGTIFIDELGHPSTVNGSPVTKIDIKKFGTAAFYSPDSTNYVTFGNYADYNLGTSTFKISGWFYIFNNTRGNSIISRRPSSVPYGWTIFVNTDKKLHFAAYVGGWYNPFLAGTTDVTTDGLHYFELGREGSNWVLSLDGNIEATTTNASAVNDLNSLTIGSSSDGGEGSIYGYLDEIALELDVAPHFTSYTPPDAPHQLETYVSQYPPKQTADYVKATSSYYANPANATDPSKSLTGSEVGNCWSAYPNSTNQRFHIDLGAAKVIKRIYYENMHISGGTLEGMKNFTFWGSNSSSAFNELTYGTDTDWTELPTDVSVFEQHIASDVSDPNYVYVENTTAYRYYAVKIADSYPSAISCRRIELQTKIIPIKEYPPAQSDTYVKATSVYGGAFQTYYPTDPTKSIYGSADNNVTWYAANGTITDQRFHIDLGAAKLIRGIYYENHHHLGGATADGVKDFTFWGTNSATAFADVAWTNVFTGGVASDDDTHSDPQYQPDKAVDGNITTRWSTGGATPLPHWWKYDLGFGNEKIVTTLKLYGVANDVTAWVFQGSNDNSNWDPLYTSTEAIPQAWTYYNFANTTAYRYYRIYITAETSDYYCSIFEIQAFENIDWELLPASSKQFDRHIGVDTNDPKYIGISNNTSYRYYAFKIENNWGGGSLMGIRRLVLLSYPVSIQEDILSDAKIKYLGVEQDILSDTDIVNARVQEDILSDATMKIAGIQEPILSDAKIKVLGIEQDILSDAKVVNVVQVDILSDAKIKVLGRQKNILSDAKMKITGLQEPILSDAQIVKYYSQYPPAQTYEFVKTTTEFPGYPGYFSTDPSKSLIGDEYPNQWYSDVGNNTNQRFHIDLGSAKAIKRIYYENMHYFGTAPEYGVKNFKIYGSNNPVDFDEFVYGTNQFTNGAFDDWSPEGQLNPDNWVSNFGPTTGQLEREETIVHSGVYSAKITGFGTPTPIWVGQFLQNLPGKDITYWQGKEITIGGWAYATEPNSVRISIWDGVEGASTYHSGSGTWEWIEFTHTINVAATNAHIHYAVDGVNVGYVDDTILLDGIDNVILNPDWENWTPIVPYPLNWSFYNSESTSTVEKETIIVKDGLYSAKLTKGDAECSLMQQIDSTKGLDYWRGRNITFKGWVWSDIPNSAELGIWDGVSGVGTRHSGSGNWEYLTVCKTIDPSATTVMPYCSAYEVGSCYFDSCKVVEDADGETTYNNDFERWDAGDNAPATGWELWSNQPVPDLTVAKESTIVHGGTYSLKLHREGGSSENWFGQKLFTEFDYPIPFNRSIEYWRGKTIRFSIWVYASVADKAFIYIWDGISGTSSPAHPGDSTWQLLEVTHTFALNATDATVDMYCTGAGTGASASCYFDDATVINETPYGVQFPTNKTLFDQHALVDAPDPKYILVDNINAYRYYTLKFFDGWGAGNMSVRRIELQTSAQIGNIFSDAKVKWLGRQRTINADSKVVNQYQEELLSDAKIKVLAVQQFIFSGARIRWFTKIFYASYRLVKNVTQNFYGRTTVTQTTPLVPNNLRANDLVKGDSILLAWDADANYGYNIYKIASRTLVNTYPIIGANEYIVGGLTTGTAYDFVVVGVNGIGEESADSNLASATPTFPNYSGLASRFQNYTYSVKINNVVRADAFLSTVELGYGTSPAVARFMISTDPFTPGLPINNDAVEVIVNNRSIFKGTIKNIEKSISSSGMAVTYIAYSRALRYMQESVSWDYVLQYRKLYNLDLADQTYLQAQETIANFLGNYRIYYNMNTDIIEQYKLGTGFWNRAVTIGKNVIDWNITYDTTDQITKVTVVGDRPKTTIPWKDLVWKYRYVWQHWTHDGLGHTWMDSWQGFWYCEIEAFNIGDIQCRALQSMQQPTYNFDPEISCVPSDFGLTHWIDGTVDSKQKLISYVNPVEEWQSLGVQIDYIYQRIGNEDIPVKAILTKTSFPKVYRAHIDSVGTAVRPGRTPAEDVIFYVGMIAMEPYAYDASNQVSYSYSEQLPANSPAGSGAPSRTVTDTQYKPFNDRLNGEDDRAYVASQMALRAGGELEKVNRPVVSGRIQILGDETFDLKTLVDVEGQKLDVIRVVHNFGNGFTTDIELTNERFRVNIPPYQEMRRTIAYQRQITGTQALLDSYRRKLQQLTDTRYTEQEKSGSIPKSPYSIYGD